MKLSKFNFELPEKLIAKYPAENRDESRLLVLHKKSGEIEHKIIFICPKYIHAFYFCIPTKSNKYKQYLHR